VKTRTDTGGSDPNGDIEPTVSPVREGACRIGTPPD
jgi:hypothetical protein